MTGNYLAEEPFCSYIPRTTHLVEAAGAKAAVLGSLETQAKNQLM
jgi:hypothetical protein